MSERIVVINDLSRPAGGATGLALLSARAFAEAGRPVTFLAGDDGENAALAAAGVEIVGFGGRRLLNAHPVNAALSGLYNRDATQMIRAWIAQHDTSRTVYHLHGWSQILSPAVFAALHPVRDRLVISAHDFFLACPNGSFAFLKTGAVCELRPMSLACITAACDRRSYRHKLWRVARHAIQRLLLDLRTPPRILALHPSMRPFLMRAGIPAAAITVLANPVTPFSRTRIPAEANRTVVFVGRLEETKGPDLAAKAARHAGLPLRFIGDGALMDSLRTQFPEAAFTGRQSPAAMAGLVVDASVLVMPSRYPEPFGLSALEALWSGLPVVAAETAFMTPDIVAAGAGFACDPRDTDGFGALLARVGSDPGLRQTMSRNAYEGTRHLGLTPSAWIAALRDLYEDCLAAARPASARR